VPSKRLGVIGAGLWGTAQAEVFASHPGVELVAICDHDGARSSALARVFGTSAYASAEEMFADASLDGVGIATPDFAHRDLVISAAEAGVDILVEKPLATEVGDVEQIARVVRERGVRLMVDFHSRYSPPLCVAKDAIDRGDLGKLVSAYFRLNDRIDVPLEMLSWSAKTSILWFLGSHAIDTLRWLTSSEVRRVYSTEIRAVLAGMGRDMADGYQTILEFQNGTVATLENHWIAPRSHPNINDIKINLLGSEGMIDMDLTNHGVVRRFLAERMDYPDVFVLPKVRGRSVGFAHASIWDFCDRLISGQPFVVGLEDGVAVTKTVCAILESSKTGNPVDVAL